MARRRLAALAAVVVAASGCSAAIDAADRKAQVPPLLLNSAPLRAAYLHQTVTTGQPLLRVSNARLNFDVLVVQGTSPEALRAGAGHFADTPYPEAPGNVAIYGQRSSYGGPFRRLVELRPGDVVEVHTPLGDHRYRVVAPFGGHANPWVVSADDPAVTSQQGPLGTGHWLTLVTSASGDSSHWLVVRLAGRRV
jgi:sortase (surface protein transpeptidase)